MSIAFNSVKEKYSKQWEELKTKGAKTRENFKTPEEFAKNQARVARLFEFLNAVATGQTPPSLESRVNLF